MIAINTPSNEEEHGKFFRLSRNAPPDQGYPAITPSSDHLPFANRNIANPQSIECTQKGDMHLCVLTDAYKQNLVVDKVSFLNIQVNAPTITTYKPPQSPNSITRIDFTKQPVYCEISGLHDTGYMVKCFGDQKQNTFF